MVITKEREGDLFPSLLTSNQFYRPDISLGLCGPAWGGIEEKTGLQAALQGVSNRLETQDSQSSSSREGRVLCNYLIKEDLTRG